jgi:hypothetical protein
MKFKKSSDAVHFLSRLGLKPEWPIKGGVIRATTEGQSYEVIGTRIWYESKNDDGTVSGGWLDENKALCDEIDLSLCD